MKALLLQAQAQLAEALVLVERALSSPSIEAAGNRAHEADLLALAAADTLSRAFEAAAALSATQARAA